MSETLPQSAETSRDDLLAVCEEAFSRAYQAEMALPGNIESGRFVVKEGKRERIRLLTYDLSMDVELERSTIDASRENTVWTAFWINRLDLRPPQIVNSNPPRLVAHKGDHKKLWYAGQDGEFLPAVIPEAESQSVLDLIASGQPTTIHPRSETYF